MSLNAKVFTSTSDLSREQWLEARKNGIGGSDIAKILGISKWGTAFTVFMDKVGEVEKEEPGEAAYWGTTLEEVVSKEFTIRTGIKVRRRNAILAHPKHEWALATVDRLLVGVDEGLECKTASTYLAHLWETDELPDEYYAQVQWYMAVTGYQAWWIAVLIGGQRFVYKRVERDEEFIQIAMRRAGDFWHNHVLTGIAPDVDASSVAADYLVKKHPTANGSTIQLQSDAEEIIQNLLDAKQREKVIEDEVSLYENQLKAMMGDNEVGMFRDYKVTWSNRTRESVDTKKLKAELPDIASKYLKTSSYRQFSVK